MLTNMMRSMNIFTMPELVSLWSPKVGVVVFTAADIYGWNKVLEVKCKSVPHITKYRHFYFEHVGTPYVMK